MISCFLLTMLVWSDSTGAAANLSNPKTELRDRALIDVDLQRQRMENALLGQLRKVLADRDKAFLGRTHTVLQAIGACRADNVVPELIEAVDFTLDPDTFPIGDRRATSDFYPVAETLRKLGNKAVITGIISAAADKSPDDRALRLYGWILIEVIGRDAAHLVMESAKAGRLPAGHAGIARLQEMLDQRPRPQMPPRNGNGNNAAIRGNASRELHGTSRGGISGLSSQNADERDRAFLDVDLQRQRLEDALLDQLRTVLAERDEAFLGRTHTVLQAIAACRADNVIPELLEAVDFTLDPDTFPVGDRRHTSNYYPVAESLRTLGNKTVITEILSAAADKSPDDRVLRIYAWILTEIVGNDAAKAIVERGKIGRVPKEQKGILRLLKMVDEEPLLEMPPRKPLGKVIP